MSATKAKAPNPRLTGGVQLAEGQHWEFVNPGRETGEYVLKRFDREGRYGSAHLRNLKTDAVASITAAWLIEGKRPSARCYWRLAD